MSFFSSDTTFKEIIWI